MAAIARELERGRKLARDRGGFLEGPTGLTRAHQEGLSCSVQDGHDGEHAARQAHGRARLSFRGGPHGHAPCIPTTGSKARARAAVFLEGRRRWLDGLALFWLVKGAEEFVRFAHPITRLIQGRADPSRRLQWTGFLVRAAAPAARTLQQASAAPGATSSSSRLRKACAFAHAI